MKSNVASGSNVSIVFYVDGKPVAINGEVLETEPFKVWATGEGASYLSEGRRAMLVVQTGRDFHKAEAELHSEQSGQGWEITAKSFGWETVDRRRYPRYDLRVPIAIRAVTETDGGPTVTVIEGYTEDVSIGGAWVKSNQTLPSSSLAEVTAELKPGTSVRALSLVKWADQDHNGLGFGVEFLDFLDGSRYALHQFLNQDAA